MKRSRGFTLIELLLSVGLTSILVAIMSQVFLAVVSVRLESQKTSTVQQDARYILARMAYDIRRASAVNSPALGVTATSLSINVPEGGVPVTYTYVANGANLLLSASSSSQMNGPLTSVRGFSVTRIGNSDTVDGGKDTLRITLELQSLGTNEDQQTFVATSSVGLR